MADSIIVLSHWLNPDRTLSAESKLRVDIGIKLLDQSVAKYIIMNGGPGRFTEEGDNQLVPRGTKPVHCEVMRDYAVSKGVPLESILMQDYSSDTIGEAYFVNELILKPRTFKTNVLVTSDYHAPRSKLIFDFILGNGSTIVEPVPTDPNTEKLKWEVDNLVQFFDLIKGIPPGDSASIEKALYINHQVYSQIPQSQRLIFYPEVH